MENPWDPLRDYIRITVKNLETEARVGLHPWEQHPQRLNRLLINVDLYAHLDGKTDGVKPSVDYDDIRNSVKNWPTRPHTLLLETLVEELVELCFRNPRVEACKVSIVKPDIFNEAEGAGVEIYRKRPK